VARVARLIETKVRDLKIPIKIAVMGCAVNGPGEAREADLGLAGGRGEALLFKKGRIVGKVKAKEMVPAVIREINAMVRNGGKDSR
jgi:(E)-4-hydroxy-3-methylbut-2-enyl-diphosphate synthase